MDYLETIGNTFWAIVEEGKENLLLFKNKEDSINKLSEVGDPITVQIISITKQGNEWSIEQVSWQEIASVLIRKTKKLVTKK
jgi:hypothetical protein